jgi:Uma2 family endonuclease
VTAEPTDRVRWAPDPMRQRLADYTIEDILLLPDDAPRVELSDGFMITVPQPTIGHQRVSALLWAWFGQQAASADVEPAGRLGVIMSHKDTLEPDLVLLRHPIRGSHHYFDPSQVLIAVEIVSPGTRRRDRLEKPALYADAGVPHFWRIELEPVHVHAYDLVQGRYVPAADSDRMLVLSKPFDIKLPILDITP